MNPFQYYYYSCDAGLFCIVHSYSESLDDDVTLSNNIWYYTKTPRLEKYNDYITQRASLISNNLTGELLRVAFKSNISRGETFQQI